MKQSTAEARGHVLAYLAGATCKRSGGSWARGRWLSRGTGHGTGRRDIRVQSALPVRSAVVPVQVIA